ncbi:MAG: hypothetical protein ACTSU5_20025 [Promethearchaeota archaeon]
MSGKNEGKLAKVRAWFGGDISKDVLLKRYIPVAWLVFLALLLGAYLTYPPGAANRGNYSILHDPISALGHYSENPGWLLFSAALVWMGLALFPVVPYAHKRLSQICRKTSLVGAFFAGLGCIGIAAVGLFPDEHDPLFGSSSVQVVDVHNIVAGIGFGGWLLAFLLAWWPVMLKDNIGRLGGEGRVPLKHVLGHVAVLLGVGLATGATQLYVSYAGLNSFDAGLLAWPFWEWTVLFTFLVCLPWFVYMLPAETGKETGKREGTEGN